MKKVLSFALVLALILGSVSMVFAAEFKDVKSTDEYSEAVNVLTGLGIVSGYPDGSYKPGQVVTRAEMAALIINALGLPVQGKALTPFKDVEYDHWASGYISYAASLNIINGYPDGTFRPDRTVSYNEALAMIINALGYTADSLVGTWPGAYVNKASGLGLLKTCRKTGDVGANRGDVACFLNDALRVPIGKTGKDGIFEPDKNGDTFAKRNGAKAFNADLQGNAVPFIVLGNEDSFINLKPYQGARVTATEKDGKIIAINEVLSEFVAGEFDLANLKLGKYKVDSAIDNALVIKHFKNGLYEGVANDTTVGTVGKLDRTWAVKVSGNYVKEIYSAHEWDIAGGETVVVTAKHVAEISGKTPKFVGIKFPVDDNDVIDKTKFALVGVDSLDDIKAGNIAYVYKDNNGFIARIEIGTGVVEGEITKVSSDNKNITIGGEVYKIAAKATDKGKEAINPGKKGTFYLDYYGKIFDAKYEEAAVVATSYGILLMVGKTSSADGLSDGRSVKMFLADGTVKVFATAKNKLADDLTDVVADFGAGPHPYKPVTARPYVVSYKLNADGQISELNKLALTVPAPAEKVSAAGLYNGKIITDDTVIFNIKTGFADPADKDEYTVVKRADVLGQNAEDDSFYVANTTDATKIDLFVIEIDTLAKVDKVYGKVTDFDRLPNEKSTVYALADGKEVTYGSGIKYKDLQDDYVDVGLIELQVTDGKLTGWGAAPTNFKNVNLNVPTPAATSVNGSFFVNNNDNKVYTLSKDVVVYINDNDDWSIGEVSDLSGLKDGSVVLYDKEDDKVYDIVIIVKPVGL